VAGRSEGLAIEPLWHDPEIVPADGVEARGGLLPPVLAARFPGELAVSLVPERPTVIANFVSSVDGVVALGRANRPPAVARSAASPTPTDS